MQSLIKKILDQKKQAGSWRKLLFETSLILTITSGLSYLLGLLRDKVFAYSLGASSDLDIYNAAFVVPDFLFAVLVSGALSAAFVPIFTDLSEQSKTKAITYTNQILSFLLVLLIIFSILFGFFLPYLTPYLVSGFTASQQAEYVSVTRIMLLAPLFFAVSNTFGNALLSTKGFLWYGVAPILYNLGIIGGVLLLGPRFGVTGLVIGTVIGAASHMLIRAQALYSYGFRPHFSLSFSPEIKQTISLMLPKMLQIGAWQIMLWWFINLATRSGEGSVTIYNFAYNFQSVPVSLIGISIALASYSQLSHLAACHEYKTFYQTLKKQSLKIFILTSLAAIVLALTSDMLVTVLLSGGKFTKESALLTAALLRIYTISIPLESLMHILARAHYALKNTLRPSLIHIVAIICSILSSTFLLPTLGIYALPLGFIAGFFIQIVFLSLSLLQLRKAHL